MISFHGKATTVLHVSLIVLACILVLLAIPSTVHASSCTSTSDCSLRGYLTNLQKEAFSIECVATQLQKSIKILNVTNPSLVGKRISQLEKLTKALTSLNQEITSINATCTTFDGPDCDMVKLCTGNTYGPGCLACKAGWNGTDCNSPICDSKCTTCSSPGVCSVCSGNWEGATCSICKSGWKGPDCTTPSCDSKCTTCTSPGVCSVCSGNWEGVTCSNCKSGWTGSTCQTSIASLVGDLQNSPMLSSSQSTRFLTDILKGVINNPLRLIYKASIHGIQGASFHSRCDNQGPTITIVKLTNSAVFGGYTSRSWASFGEYVLDGSAFMYKLLSSDSTEVFKKIGLSPTAKNSVYYNTKFGPCFGDDFGIGDDTGAWSAVRNFDQATGLTANYYSGGFSTNVQDIEVYTL